MNYIFFVSVLKEYTYMYMLASSTYTCYPSLHAHVNITNMHM